MARATSSASTSPCSTSTKDDRRHRRPRVVHDVVTENGETVEDTFDWYAQDAFGNLWYLGEDTKEYENGKVASTEGSWEAGVDGAQAGIILPADPTVGHGLPPGVSTPARPRTPRRS